MLAIETRYMGPTNNLGSRIKATADNGESVTVGYPHDRHEGADAHSVAALALARKMGWDGELIAGATKDGYAFVFANSDRYAINETDEDRERAHNVRLERMNARLAS